jgi:AcrR family transcriptional regulator
VLTRKTQEGTPGAPDRDHPGAAIDRFERRRTDIIAAAIPVLNGHGFKGMRLTAVAELIGLRATGVTYYFPRKEDLAIACLESGFAIFHDLLANAEREPCARSRIARLIELFVERDAAVRRGEAMPLASFSAIRALEGEHRIRVVEGYKRMFRRVRALLDTLELAAMDKVDRTIRTLILLEQLFWASSWLGDFDTDDFPRLAQRMTDIVVNGVAPLALAKAPRTLDLNHLTAKADTSKESFLMAATRQINAHGYRGASVDRISASLNLTKGAFYHHNEAKDDLVAACFRRSFDIMREAQRQAREIEESEGRRLAAVVEGLIRFQLGPEGPLLRTSVLSSMPPEQQVEIISHSYRVSRQFAATVADAIADGSGRPVDPSVAGAMVHAAINIASDARVLKMAAEPDIVTRFVKPLFLGFLKTDA